MILGLLFGYSLQVLPEIGRNPVKAIKNSANSRTSRGVILTMRSEMHEVADGRMQDVYINESEL